MISDQRLGGADQDSRQPRYRIAGGGVSARQIGMTSCSTMDVWMIAAAFAAGFVARSVGLPPLVGYLTAGFGLHAFGFESSSAVDAISDLGILLLLFGIGLKLKLRTLTQPRVWVTTSAMATVTTGVVTVAILGLAVIGVAPAVGISISEALIVGFALSFSSTVFAVKALEATDETASLTGQLAIGVLIMQDIFAVGFLVATGGSTPTWWAVPAVIGLLAARPLMGWVLTRSGHGEILVLLGFTLAVAAGAGLFEATGLKADLGALVAGILLSTHPRSNELADRLLAFKDLFLVGFFLSIGLAGTPATGEWVVGAGLVALIVLRSVGYVWAITRFRLRSRTALHTSLTLSTYSEFGLIVAAAATAGGLLDDAWVSTIAVAVSVSFVVASLASTRRYRLYELWSRALSRWERSDIVSEDAVFDCGFARILVFGMGRVGTGAYDQLVLRRGRVVGVDHLAEVVAKHRADGRSVIRGNVLDRDFWERLQLHSEVELVVAATSNHTANLEAVRRIREFLPGVRIAGIALYADQVDELRDAGVDIARNLYEEAGQGLADDAVAVVYEE